MDAPSPDNGLLSVIYSILKREKYQRHGDDRENMNLLMGCILVAMGATMTMKAWNAKHPPRGRGR